jgi:hypothetical protein
LNSQSRIGFVYYPELTLPDGTVIDGPPVRNIIPDSGLNHIGGLILGMTAPISSWYAGLFGSNYLPVPETVAADIPVNMAEILSYSATSRPQWAATSTAAGVLDSALNRAEFEFVTGARVHGGFVCSSSVKGFGGGLLFSVARFSAPIDVIAGSTLRLRIATILTPV